MFSFDNTHIFTGYLKQLLSSFNLPTCKVYTSDFNRFLELHGKEDPRIVESFDTVNENRLSTRINYLKDNEVYNLFLNSTTGKQEWRRANSMFYDKDKRLTGLTRTLKSSGSAYDTKTHEYLGEYLRFLRDYYNVDLMSLYNCFNNKLYTNVVARVNRASFDYRDSKYKIYAVPVKLFAKYTIAIDCNQGVELFCGLYNISVDNSDRAQDLINRTYQKINKTMFNQPFLYDKLTVDYWRNEDIETLTNTKKISRCDILNREQDLKLFIKVPVSCKSSITILEGDFRHFNDAMYAPVGNTAISWEYKANHSVVNFDNKSDLNSTYFKPISKLQLLAFNTGESYPFADRLTEYLSGSAITPMDEIPDNIKRVQKVMKDNKYYFRIEGIWENQIQKIAYDYMVNAGPIKLDKTSGKLVDKRQGTHPSFGHTSKSTFYDVLGYIDKDTEKCYASWKKENDTAKVRDSIQNVDIYIDKNGKSLWDV